MCVAEDHWSRPEQVIDVLAALGVPEIRAAPFLHHELEPVAASMAAEHAAWQHPIRAPDEISSVAGRHTVASPKDSLIIRRSRSLVFRAPALPAQISPLIATGVPGGGYRGERRSLPPISVNQEHARSRERPSLQRLQGAVGLGQRKGRYRGPQGNAAGLGQQLAAVV